MIDLLKVLPERIQARIDALPGKSKRGVSLAIGAHPGWVRDLFDPERFSVPGAVRLEMLAAELETTTDYLLGKTDNPAQVMSEVSFHEAQMDFRGAPRSEPPVPLVGTGDCADLQVCDESGAMVEIERSSFDPDYHVRYLTRPAALIGARDVYAIQFHGESMVPRYEPGDIGFVDPNRPFTTGDYVLVQLAENGDGEVTSALAKRLVRRTQAHVVLEQFNPPLTFTIERDKVARIHRILRSHELHH